MFYLIDIVDKDFTQWKKYIAILKNVSVSSKTEIFWSILGKLHMAQLAH